MTTQDIYNEMLRMGYCAEFLKRLLSLGIQLPKPKPKDDDGE